MHQDNLVWDDAEEATSFNQHDQSIQQEQADCAREALIGHHRAQRTLSILQALISVPFWIGYALLLARMVLDSMNSWSLREAHQMIVAITEPLLGQFMEMTTVSLGVSMSINPAHLIALVTAIVVHLFVTVLARFALR